MSNTPSARRLTQHAYRIGNKAVEAAENWLAINRRNPKFLAIGHKGPKFEEVTGADLHVNRIISEILTEEEPAWSIVSEEAPRLTPSTPHWLLDPIDGTINFARGGPIWTISLALIVDAQPIMGIISAPDMHYRSSPESAKIDTNAYKDIALADALIGISGAGSSRMEQLDRIVESIRATAYRVRIHGSMSFDLVAVSEGWINASICIKPDPWDVAAGVFLARTRGYVTFDLEAHEYIWGSPVLICGPRTLAERLANIVRSAVH